MGDLKVWDAFSGEEILNLEGRAGNVVSVSFSPNGKRIVSANSERTLQIWDAIAGEELLTLRVHGSQVTSAAFTQDGKRLVAACEDQTLRIWDASAAKVFTRRLPGTPIYEDPEKYFVEIIEKNMDNYWIVDHDQSDSILVKPKDVPLEIMQRLKVDMYQFMRDEGYSRPEWK